MLEPTNESYALAKIAGIKLCASMRNEFGFDAISLMPTNLYGPGDNYSLESSHVLPALIRKFDEAKQSNSDKVVCYGTGDPLREFLYVDDLAEACLYTLENWIPSKNNSPLNSMKSKPTKPLRFGKTFKILSIKLNKWSLNEG